MADPDPEANDVDITIEGDEGDEAVKEHSRSSG